MITDTSNREHYYAVNKDKLRQARGERSAADVARRIDVSRQILCDWEAGRVRVRHSKLVQLADLYGEDLSYFLQ